MTVTHDIDMDLLRPGVRPLVCGVQGERCSRVLCFHLTRGGTAFSLPEGAAAAVRFRKADGTGGIYDALPDGTAACVISANTVSVTLAPQVLTCAGPAVVQLELYLGEQVLSSFSVCLLVEADPSAGADPSEDYYNWQQAMAAHPRFDQLQAQIDALAQSSGLPQVDEGDEGKLLQVVDGAWELVDPDMPEGLAGDGVTDDAPAIQLLLDTNDEVILPKGTYYLQSSLKMNRDHCRFVCKGTLLVNAETALELGASFCHVKIAHIKSKYNGSWSEETSWVFPVSGIKLGSDTVRVYFNTVEVDSIERCKNGIWLAPSGENTGVAHNILKFGDIFAEYGIHFQPGDGAYVFICANHFYGGKLRGKHPVYTEPGANQTDPFNGNTFHHIALEGCQREMVLNFFCYNAFRELRLSPQENEIVYPDPHIVFDEHSFGNVISNHGSLNIDQISDPYKSGTTWGWAHWLGNEYAGKSVVCGKQGVETFLGDSCRSSYGSFIVENRRGIHVEGRNRDIDLSADKHAIDGLICYCTAASADVNIRLARGYHYFGARKLYVYVAQRVDPWAVRVKQYDEELGEDVDIVPASVFTEPGMYELECVYAIGWLVRKLPGSYLFPVDRIPAIATPVEPDTLAAWNGWYDTEAAGAAMDTITDVTFTNRYSPDGTEDASWAADRGGTGTIMAYRRGTSVVVTATTGARKIKLNPDSQYMFAAGGSEAAYGQFSSLAQIQGTELFVASDSTNMQRLCQNNAALASSIRIPKGVTNLENAFKGCTALTEPPVLPDTVTDMGSAFLGCSAMKTLPDIPANAVELDYAFQGCTALTDVTGCVIPESAANIRAMFNGAANISGTVEINALSLTDYANAFKNAPNTAAKQVKLTGTCPVLTEIAATNTAGYVTA